MAEEILTLIPKITWRELVENRVAFKNFDLGNLTYSYIQQEFGGNIFTGNLVIKKSFRDLTDPSYLGPDVLVLDGLEKSSGTSYLLDGGKDGGTYTTRKIGYVLFWTNPSCAVSPDDLIPTNIADRASGGGFRWYPVVLDYTPYHPE